MASEERDQLLANLRRLQLRHAVNRIDDLLRDAAHLKLGHLGFLARVVDGAAVHGVEIGRGEARQGLVGAGRSFGDVGVTGGHRRDELLTPCLVAV